MLQVYIICDKCLFSWYNDKCEVCGFSIFSFCFLFIFCYFLFSFIYFLFIFFLLIFFLLIIFLFIFFLCQTSYFKLLLLASLEDFRTSKLEESATLIQKHFRGMAIRKYLVQLHRSAIKIQNGTFFLFFSLFFAFFFPLPSPLFLHLCSCYISSTSSPFFTFLTSPLPFSSPPSSSF
jgi:IQ calmodulin-binding motif